MHDETDDLADRIAGMAASMDAACQRLLADLRRFDHEQGWARQGMISCATWLSWRCGISLGAAREKVRVAHALATLPLIDDALGRGQISYSKVRAMTRVATPANEENLLQIALHSTASQLEKTCRIVLQLQPRTDDRDAPPSRWLRVRDTEDGMVRIEVQLRPEEASRVLAACSSDPSAGTRLDGFLAMTEGALRGDRPERPPIEVMVHVDASTLEGRTVDAGIPPETARRLLCDAGVVPVLGGESGATVDVGRKTRVLSAALRRALAARDGGCCFPGCTNRRFVDAHHVRHWVHGGATCLSNLTTLCSLHHTLVHEGGFQVVGDGDQPRFVDLRGNVVPEVGLPRDPHPLPRCAPHPTWDGAPVDWDSVVAAVVA